MISLPAQRIWCGRNDRSTWSALVFRICSEQFLMFRIFGWLFRSGVTFPDFISFFFGLVCIFCQCTVEPLLNYFLLFSLSISWKQNISIYAKIPNFFRMEKNVTENCKTRKLGTYLFLHQIFFTSIFCFFLHHFFPKNIFLNLKIWCKKIKIFGLKNWSKKNQKIGVNKNPKNKHFGVKKLV